MTKAASGRAVARPYDLATADHDYPVWQGPPRRSLLICTHPRSGSTLLGEALYFAGGLGCPLEYFHVGFRPRFEARWSITSTADFTERVWRARTDPGGTLAVKLMWRDVQELALELDPGLAMLESAPPEQVTPETYRRLAALLATILPNPDWVHLQRLDRLRQAVSASVATQTGLWRSIPGAEADAQAEPRFDAAEIERLIGYSDFCHGHWRNLFAAIGVAPVALTYESLSGDYSATVGRVFTKLGSDAPPPPVRMRRQAGGVSEAFVRRYLSERA